MAQGRRTVSPTLGSITPPTATGATTALGVGGRSRTIGVMIVVTIVVVVPLITVVIVLTIVVVTVVTRAQFDVVTLLSFNVTAPVCTRAFPFKVAPVFKVMLARARIFPVNSVPEPRVAELGTRHHTLHGSPPTTLPVVVVVRPDDDLKIQTPDPTKVSVPDNAKPPAGAQ
jgi:hypothetical protein